VAEDAAAGTDHSSFMFTQARRFASMANISPTRQASQGSAAKRRAAGWFAEKTLDRESNTPLVPQADGDNRTAFITVSSKIGPAHPMWAP